MVEQPGEIRPFQDRDLPGGTAGLLGGFELGDRIVGQPIATDGVAADLVERILLFEHNIHTSNSDE